MTFDEWWINTGKTYEVPTREMPYSQAKLLAKMAWRVGVEEGRIIAGKLYRESQAEKEAS